MIGIKIKRIREDRKLSQLFVAEKLGISQNAYSKLENNISKLTIDRLKDIARILEVPDEELLISQIIKLPTVMQLTKQLVKFMKKRYCF